MTPLPVIAVTAKAALLFAVSFVVTTAFAFSIADAQDAGLNSPQTRLTTITTVSEDAFRAPQQVEESAWQNPVMPAAAPVDASSAVGVNAFANGSPPVQPISYTTAQNRGAAPETNTVTVTPVSQPQAYAPESNVAVEPSGLEVASPATYLQRGRELEQSGLWGEALALYQQGLKEFPDSENLGQRRSIARIHFDLDRRYSDSSFLQTISETSAQKALNVYSEVLLRIQSYYVDEPQWSQLAGFGLSSLEVALRDPDFRSLNLPRANDQAIERSLDSLKQQLRQYPASTRHDVYVIAGTAARIMESEIGLKQQATVYEFVCGAISALDPYSAFMSSNQYNETMSQIEGNFVGLGVELRTHADHLEIVSVIKGGSADAGGMERGDRIIAVNNISVSESGSERAADALRGVEGSYVRIEIDRGGIPTDLNLERRRVEIPSVDNVSIIDPGAGVGYIQLTNFQKTTARDFDAALWQLQRQGMQTLIVDVRGNPGGLLKAAVEVADRFIRQGVIVSTKGRNPLEDFTHRAQAAGTWRVPLVVLIDENSASASEIFAAAIRDHGAGEIVGNQSYGKGSVQGIFPLNVSGGGVRLTTARFYSPSGQAISQVGVKADYTVTETARPDESGERLENDAGLRIAVGVARDIIGQRNAGQTRSVAGR
ncbi:MAG: S41 family peptidase [Planctomycetota bacterium]